MEADDRMPLSFGRAEEALVPHIEARAWPRYFARMLDVLIFSSVLMFVLVILLVFVDEALLDSVLTILGGMGGTIVSNIVSPVLAMLPIAFLLGLGQTPGKWLFGIRVRDRDGRRIRMWPALRREVMVYVRGLGLGLPLISLFTLVMSHSDLKSEGVTSWDKSLGLTVSHEPATWVWWLRATLGAIVVLGAVFWGLIEQFRSLV